MPIPVDEAVGRTIDADDDASTMTVSCMVRADANTDGTCVSVSSPNGVQVSINERGHAWGVTKAMMISLIVAFATLVDPHEIKRAICAANDTVVDSIKRTIDANANADADTTVSLVTELSSHRIKATAAL